MPARPGPPLRRPTNKRLVPPADWTPPGQSARLAPADTTVSRRAALTPAPAPSRVPEATRRTDVNKAFEPPPGGVRLRRLRLLQRQLLRRRRRPPAAALPPPSSNPNAAFVPPPLDAAGRAAGGRGRGRGATVGGRDSRPAHGKWRSSSSRRCRRISLRPMSRSRRGSPIFNAAAEGLCASWRMLRRMLYGSSVAVLAQGNLDMSRRRAPAVASQLIRLGVPRERIVARQHPTPSRSTIPSTPAALPPIDGPTSPSSSSAEDNNNGRSSFIA